MLGSRFLCRSASASHREAAFLNIFFKKAALDFSRSAGLEDKQFATACSRGSGRQACRSKGCSNLDASDTNSSGLLRYPTTNCVLLESSPSASITRKSLQASPVGSRSWMITLAYSDSNGGAVRFADW